jgi:S1-C subfamily serine protease
MFATPVSTNGVVTIGRDGRGTGFVLSPGRVVTNSHHLRDRTTQVTFEGGRSVQATVVGIDAEGDLAVLEVDTADAPDAAFATSAPAVGDAVRAIGRAGTTGRVTVGWVSAVGQTFRGPGGRVITGALEHTAPLPRGATGGPIVDGEGAIVGITTLRLPDGFAIARPTDAALQERLRELAAGQSVARRTIGITIAPSEVASRLRRSVGLPARDGLLVRDVRAGSPAERGGLRTGDLVVAVDGEPVATPDALANLIDQGPADRTIALTIVRGAEELVVDVSLGESPPG